MIDPGATHSSLWPRWRDLNPVVLVSLGNGDSVHGTGICQGVELGLKEEW